MAVLAFGAIGAAAGYVAGGYALTAWGSLGWALGIGLGQGVVKTKLPMAFGPELADLSITSSAFGQMIPFGYGTFPVPGNIIWSTQWRRNTVVTEVETGGKGGSKTTQTQV